MTMNMNTPCPDLRSPSEAYKRLASMTGWAIAEHFGCAYSGDSDPIKYGGFFFDPRDWAEGGYARAVEFWHDPENGNLVVQRGVIYKPRTPEEWSSCWSAVGIAADDPVRQDVHAQIEAARAGLGIEPGGTRWPDLMEFDLATWKEWRVWKSVADWLTELGRD